MSRHINKPQQWSDAFDAVVPHYQETKSTNGSIGALDYEVAGNSTGGGRNPRIARPSTSDLICDVEIAARRALQGDKEAYGAWLGMYQSLEVTFDQVPQTELVKSVKERVGKILVSRGIHPLASYMRPKDCR